MGLLRVVSLCTLLLLLCDWTIQDSTTVSSGANLTIPGICRCFEDGSIDLACVHGCVQTWGTKCFLFLVFCPLKVQSWLGKWTKGIHLASYQHSLDGAVLDWKVNENFLQGWGLGRILEYGQCALDLVPKEGDAKEYHLKAACTWKGETPGDLPLSELSPPSNLKAFVSDRTFDSMNPNRTLEVTFEDPAVGPVPSDQEIECLSLGNFTDDVDVLFSNGPWGSPVVFNLEGKSVEWSCRVRGSLAIVGPWSRSLHINSNLTTGSKPVVQISHENYWNDGEDLIYKISLEGADRGTVLDMVSLPKDTNGSKYASYDAAGQYVYSNHPFAFDHIGRYRYEIGPQNHLITRVDPYDSWNDTIIFNGSREGNDSADKVGYLEYDSTLNVLFFTSQTNVSWLWSLKMINLSTSTIDILRSDLLSPAITLISEQESPAVLYFNVTGLWSMSLLNGSWNSQLVATEKQLLIADMRLVTLLSADQSYVYYVDRTEGLHVFDRNTSLSRTVSVVSGMRNQDQDPKHAMSITPYWPIRQIHSLQAYRPENRPIHFASSLITCFYPKLSKFEIRMTSENSADAILSLEPNVNPECQKVPTRPPYQCLITLSSLSNPHLNAETPKSFSVVSRNLTIQMPLEGLQSGGHYNCSVLVGPYNWTFFGLPPASTGQSFQAIYATDRTEWDPWLWVIVACLIVAIIVIFILVILLFSKRRVPVVESTPENWQHHKLELERSGLVPFIGDTEITFEGVLGTGRYGPVYKGRRKQSYEEVVLKLLDEEHVGSDSEDMKTQFFHEALVWARLHKRNAGEIARGGGDRILDLIAVSISKDATILIAEYMNGGRCDEYLRRYRQHLDRTDALRIAKDIATACVYMTDRGYVHGDLNLRRVYVRMRKDNTRKPLVAKLAGFHESKHSDETRLSSVRERYCAPEGFSGFVTEKTDVWSFGILVWELFMFFEVPENCAPLPYYPPIGPQAPTGTVRRYVLDEKRRIDCPDHWPSTLIGILDSSWLYEPNARPTFNELAQALEAVQFTELALRTVSESEGNTPKQSVRPKRKSAREDKVPLLDETDPQ